MKEKILSLMKEGLGKEVAAAYVREHTISPKLTAAEIVEWKKAGIPEPVISARSARNERKRLSQREARMRPAHSLCSVYWLLVASLSISIFGAHEALAFDKGPSSAVIDALGAGQPQDLLVLLDDRAVRVEAAQLRARAKLPYDDSAILALKAARYAALKEAVLANVLTTSGELAVLQDYRLIPMMFLRFRSLMALRQIVAHGEVAAVYEVRANRPLLNESLPLIHQPEVAAAGQIGEGTTVAVLDKGVDYTRPAFGPCSAVGVPVGCRVVYARDFTPTDDGMLDDDDHHGTNVAAIVVGVAPGTRIAALDVFRADGNAYDPDIILAIDWAIQHQSDLNIVAMNLSLGPIGVGYPEPCSGDPLAVPIANAKEAGIVPVVAAGNDGYRDRISRPACAPDAVSVGAVYDSDVGLYLCSPPDFDFPTYADLVTCSSNTAVFLTMLAPGCRVTAGSPAGGPDLTACGTSQAAPFVAGAAAVLRAAFPSETLDQTIFRMTSSGVPVPDRGWTYTRPRLHLLAATLLPTQSVSLTAEPASGPAPLSTALTASVSGTATGTINYTFWWNCSDPGTSVSAVTSACGDPTDPVVGAKFDGVTDNPKAIDHIYSSTGMYIAKVIAERGAAPPAESKATVVVSPPCTAGQLPLNGGGSGMLDLSHGMDMWCITTAVDGALTVNVATDPSTQFYVTLGLYDTDGTQLAYTTCGAGSVSKALRPGTYFAQVATAPFCPGGNIGSYTISNTFTAAALPNDVEPNDSAGTAQVLALGSSTTGHLGYYSLGSTDTADWFKVVTAVDGALTVNVATDPSTQFYVTLWLYDTDGTLLAPLTPNCGAGSVSRALRPGTYFAQVATALYCPSGSIGSYTISNTFTAAALPNDVEPNDSAGTAQVLALGSSTTGHLGYYSFGSTDTADWFKVVTAVDGALTVNVATDPSTQFYVTLGLYDTDGTLLAYTTCGAGSVSRALRPGTYFAQVATAPFCPSGNIGSYTISTALACPSASPTPSNNGPLCAGGNLQLVTSFVSGATYSWTGPNGFTSSQQNPSIPNATVLASGNYSVAVTVDGCTSLDGTTAVTVNPTPTAVASGSATIPPGSSTPLTGSGGVSCSWSPATGLSSATSCTPTASPSVTTTYTLTVTDANGCVSTNNPTVIVTVLASTTTTTTVASSANPSVIGQSVTFTANVTSGSGTPTGTVTFKDGASTVGTGSLSAGIATLSTSALAVGSHSITAAYGGDATFGTSTSPPLTQTVNPAPPTIKSFKPTNGVAGTNVTINGTNLANATSVTFNGSPANVTSDTSSQINADVPTDATTGKISVTTPGGTAASTGTFTVKPNITGFTPTSGAVGAQVTINGTGFSGATSVKFDGTAASIPPSHPSTQIVTNVPANATTGKITVTTPGGTATSSSDFTVAPRITSFTPTSGIVGASITINGANFTGVTSVKFNGISAGYTVKKSIKITATVPAGATTGKISVTTSAGTATSTSDFTVN